MKSGNYEKRVNLAIDFLLVLIGCVAIYPIWYVLIASVSSPAAISKGEVILLPKGLNFSAYETLFQNKQIWTGYRNSLLYTTVGTLLDLSVMIPCAYALSRRSLPGGSVLMKLFVFTMYFSGGMIPSYLLVNSLGMVNTPWALIVPSCVNVYNMIVARSFFLASIPEALFDAARIDGCNYTRFFFRVVLPLSPAVLAILALFSIQARWNAYLTPQIYIYSPNLRTLQQVIQGITANLDTTLLETATVEQISRVVQEKQLLKYAVVIVGSLPLVILYPFVQKFFVKGIMVGAVKG